MAGTPIKRLYNARIQSEGGAGRILDRVATGERFADIARTLNVSRSFLSDYIRLMPAGKAAIHLARLTFAEFAAHDALLKAEAKLKATGRGSTDAIRWIQARGGFRKVGGSEPSASPDIPTNFFSERQAENGRLHLAAVKKASELDRLGRREEAEPGTHSDPFRHSWLGQKTD